MQTHSPPRLRLLLIGDPDRLGLAGSGWLQHEALSLHTAATLRAAADGLRSQQRHADLIVICCPRLGRLAAGDVEQLRRIAPLTPIVALHSSWG